MDHHYLPQFYLNRWVDGLTKKVVYYSVKNGEIKENKISPKATGYEVDLYSKENVPEDQKHIVETNHYKQIDDAAAKILNKILTMGVNKLTDTEKNKFSQFIFSLLTRHVNNVEKTKKDTAILISNKINNLSREEKILHENEIANLNLHNITIDLIASMSAPANSPNNHFKILNLDDFIKVFLQMDWWLEDFKSTNFTLLTSDHPIILSPCIPDNNSYPTIREKLLYGTHILSFPLSPNFCFFVYKNFKDVSPNNKAKLIKSRNLATVSIAKKFIYAKDESQRKFIEKHWNKNLEK